jgi:two-component system response regulator YesN
LEECASRLNYHPVYVSRILKKETGLSFSEYLSRFRMSMAKKWLTDTEMRVSEIANRLNYTNSSTFIRYFNKSEGITPGQYRKAHLK